MLFARAARSPLLSPLLRATVLPISTRVAFQSTITDALTKDHRELEQCYNEIINNPNDHDHQDRFANQFVWELARHSIGEELVVYPALERWLGDGGKEMAENDRQQHHSVRSLASLPSKPLANTTLTR